MRVYDHLRYSEKEYFWSRKTMPFQWCIKKYFWQLNDKCNCIRNKRIQSSSVLYNQWLYCVAKWKETTRRRVSVYVFNVDCLCNVFVITMKLYCLRNKYCFVSEISFRMIMKLYRKRTRNKFGDIEILFYIIFWIRK